MDMTSAFTRVGLTLECASSKSVLRPGLLHLLQCRAFRSSLRDGVHYGPKVLDFPGLFHQPKTLNPSVHGLTSILASFPREGTDLTKGISAKVWQRDLSNSYIIDFLSAFCLASATYGSEVPHGP